jgi:hypothetical protein
MLKVGVLEKNSAMIGTEGFAKRSESPAPPDVRGGSFLEQEKKKIDHEKRKRPYQSTIRCFFEK